jgi:hypothetical protein
MLFGSNRQALREVFFRAWQQHRAGRSPAGAEHLIVLIALQHPEYHALLDNPADVTDRDYTPEQGGNPFLHMAMHIAIEEQLSVDQPPGIREHFAALCRRSGDEHDAQHQMMECLGECLWQASRSGLPPDNHAYLDCLQRLAAANR